MLLWSYTSSMDDLSLLAQAPLSESSFAEPASDTTAPAGPDGFDFLTKLLAKGIHAQTYAAVTSIHQHEASCEIRTAGGAIYHADSVVVTVPLGVLKACVAATGGAKPISFSPPLSERKVAAINALGSGTENKIVLRFEESFWPKDAQFQCTDQRFRFINLDRLSGSTGVLVAHVAPPFSLGFDGLADDARARARQGAE